MVRHRRQRVSYAGMLAFAIVAVLSAGATAAYSMNSRRAAAARHAPRAEPRAATLRLAASPASVVFGGRVRVSGVLRDAAGAPLAGRSVEVVGARSAGSLAPAVWATPLTDWRGQVTATFRPAAGSVLWLRYAGAADVTPALSAKVRIGVGQRVSVAARTARVRGGWRTTFRGTVRPAVAGQPVRLERHTGTGWRRVASGRTGRGGSYSFGVRSTRVGAFRYRVVRPAGPALAAAVTGYTLRLRARPAVRVPAFLSGGGGPGELLVTGDSFAYFLGQQLTVARRPRGTTVESRPSTGLARPDYYDWAPRARAQVKAKPGAVVVFLGANDCQPVRTGGSGAWTPTGSAGWRAEYRRRAAALMRVYAGDGARPVYWVGLPIAKKPDIAACYRAMNAATAAAARDVRGVTWVDSWRLYAVDGGYSDYVGGILARQDDGIHFTFEGTRLLTRRVYALLRP